MEIMSVLRFVERDVNALPYANHAHINRADVRFDDDNKVIVGGTIYVAVELNDNGNGLEDTRDRVMDAIESYGYHSVRVSSDLDFYGDVDVIYAIDYLEAVGVIDGRM